MNIYKHIVYNPHLRNIQSVIQEAQDSGNLEGGNEWKFESFKPVTEYEWVAIFQKWQDEITGMPTEEIPQMKGTQEALDDLLVKE